MTETGYRLIERIHQTPHQAVIAVTGGGASAIAKLLAVPGGSRTLLEARVPYSEAALTDWLGGRRPEQFCTEETALAMASVALERAGRLQESAPAAGALPGQSRPPLVGVACTASLVSDRPKEGDHRCFIATQTKSTTRTWSVIFEKEARDRAGEERLVGNLIVQALASAAGIVDLPPLDVTNREPFVEHLAAAGTLLLELLEGKRGIIWSLPGAETIRAPERRATTADSAAGAIASPSLFALHGALPFPHSPPAGLICGAFHPLHQGHRQLREVAERLLGGPVYYEMSIRNVDKPPLDYLSIDRRRAQFPQTPLALTAAPTFAEKAAITPGVTFVVGADTAERIIHPRYYGGSEAMRDGALRQVRDAGCRFLVAGRKLGEAFQTLSYVRVPAEFSDLFRAIPERTFRVDISSTELRRAE